MYRKTTEIALLFRISSKHSETGLNLYSDTRIRKPLDIVLRMSILIFYPDPLFYFLNFPIDTVFPDIFPSFWMPSHQSLLGKYSIESTATISFLLQFLPGEHWSRIVLFSPEIYEGAIELILLHSSYHPSIPLSIQLFKWGAILKIVRSLSLDLSSFFGRGVFGVLKSES